MKCDREQNIINYFSNHLQNVESLSAPYNNSRYLLNQEKYHDQIFSNFEQYSLNLII